MDIGLHHHRMQGMVDAPAGLQDAEGGGRRLDLSLKGGHRFDAGGAERRVDAGRESDQ